MTDTVIEKIEKEEVQDAFDDKMENVRQVYLALGEASDAWRLMPRLIVMVYIYGLYLVCNWFMGIDPVLSPDGATVLLEGPTTQQAAFVSTLLGLGGAIFAFYSNSGRNWERGITSWKKMLDPSLVITTERKAVISERHTLENQEEDELTDAESDLESLKRKARRLKKAREESEEPEIIPRPDDTDDEVLRHASS